MVASKEYTSRNFMLPLPESIMGRLTDVWLVPTSISRNISRHMKRSSRLTLSNSLFLVTRKKMYLSVPWSKWEEALNLILDSRRAGIATAIILGVMGKSVCSEHRLGENYNILNIYTTSTCYRGLFRGGNSKHGCRSLGGPECVASFQPQCPQ